MQRRDSVVAMAWSELFLVKFSDYTGYVKSLAEARHLIDVFKQETLTDYNKYKKAKLVECGKNVDRSKRCVFWGDEEQFSEFCMFDGIPFIVLGREVKECHRGPDRNIYNKTKYKQMVESENYTKKRRLAQLMQNTKKTGCPAKLSMKQVVKFMNFKLQPGNDNKAAREQICKELKDLLRTGQITSSETRIYINLPKDDDHQNHSLGKESGQDLKMDERLAKFIDTKVVEGVRSVNAMNCQLRGYVASLFPTGNLPPQTSRRFYPKLGDIRGKIMQCVRNLHAKEMLQNTGEDSPFLTEIIKSLSARFPLDFCLLKYNECDMVSDPKKNPSLFVYQTSYQRRLLAKYGNEICVLDTALKDLKDVMQLYFLYVKTNVNYSIAACICTSQISKELLQEGLRAIKEWNSDWKPFYWMCRMDKCDIQGLEEEFPGCQVYINDLCREHDWMRWISMSGNNILNPRMAMRFLRKLADAPNENEYRAALDSLQATYMWRINRKLREWFGTTWLAEEKRWSRAFQEADFVWKMNAGANSRMKWQHEEGDRGANLLSPEEIRYLNLLLWPLVTRTFPSHYQKYLDGNRLDHLEVARTQPVLRFLDDMPKCNFDHVSKIYDSVLLEPTPTCNDLGCGNFLIVSGEDDAGNPIGLKISFGDEDNMPSCSCESWYQHRLPCTHFCQVFLQFPAWGWHSFPEKYRNCVYFAADRQAPPAPVPQPQVVAAQSTPTVESADIDDLLLMVASECETTPDACLPQAELVIVDAVACQF